MVNKIGIAILVFLLIFAVALIYSGNGGTPIELGVIPTGGSARLDFCSSVPQCTDTIKQHGFTDKDLASIVIECTSDGQCFARER